MPRGRIARPCACMLWFVFMLISDIFETHEAKSCFLRSCSSVLFIIECRYVMHLVPGTCVAFHGGNQSCGATRSLLLALELPICCHSESADLPQGISTHVLCYSWLGSGCLRSGVEARSRLLRQRDAETLTIYVKRTQRTQPQVCFFQMRGSRGAKSPEHAHSRLPRTCCPARAIEYSLPNRSPLCPVFA